MLDKKAPLLETGKVFPDETVGDQSTTTSHITISTPINALRVNARPYNEEPYETFYEVCDRLIEETCTVTSALVAMFIVAGMVALAVIIGFIRTLLRHPFDTVFVVCSITAITIGLTMTMTRKTNIHRSAQ
jgi:hypothetical protein